MTTTAERARDELDLAPFLDASSVAVIGASDDYYKVGGRVLHYLLQYRYDGVIYPVNPRRTETLGLTTYASIDDLPEAPELAIIAVPVAAVQGAVEQAGRRGIRAAVVFASGYAEVGEEGEALQRELGRVAAETGIRVLGPNCVGAVGAARGLTASMMTGLEQDRFSLRDDGIAFVSQSGAVGAFLFNMAQGHGIGLGRFVSTGNEVDISLGEVTQALVDDERTRAVLGYVEGVRDPESFRRALELADRRGVPMSFMKVGRTARGADAAASHTGSLAGEDVVYDGLFAQYGVHRADSYEELLDFGRIMTLPVANGTRATILTISGGAGILAVDAAERFGVDVPTWQAPWRERMAELLPGYAATGNPIDTAGGGVSDPERLAAILDLCDENPDSDVTMLIIGNMEKSEDQVIAVLEEAGRRSSKPVVVVWVGGSGRPLSKLTSLGIPTFEDPIRAMRAVGQWMSFGARQRGLTDEVAVVDAVATADSRDLIGLLDDARAAGRTTLDEATSKTLLAKAGLPVVSEHVVADPDAAADAAEDVGFPVVLKLLSDEIAHKSDLGVVRLGLGSRDEVTQAAQDILRIAENNGVHDRRLVVQPFVTGDTEIIIGMKHDGVFGPVVLLGIGGVLTEIAADVAVRLTPFGREEALRMIESLAYVALLEGPRGRQAVDKGVLADVLVRFSQLTQAISTKVDSMEINPFIVRNDGSLVAVDALVILDDAADADHHHGTTGHPGNTPDERRGL